LPDRRRHGRRGTARPQSVADGGADPFRAGYPSVPVRRLRPHPARGTTCERDDRPARRARGAAEMTIDSLPPSLARNRRLDRWVEIRTDGVVEVRTGKVEIGQGIVSALAQIAAEELDVDYARIRMIPADTGRSPNEGVTAGSRSIMDGGGALRQACAEVRDAFLRAAARRLNTGVDELFVRDGTIHRKASNESATYWELSDEVDLSRDADGRAAPKRADQLTLVGKPLPRLDLPDKV